MAPHSSTLAWKIPWMEEAGRLQSLGSLRVGHDWETSLSLFTFMHWRRKWQSTRVLAWRIPEKGKPGGLPSLGSHRVGHDWSDLAAAAAAAVVCLNFSLLKIIFEKQPLIIKTLANSVIFYALTSCFFFTALILPDSMLYMCWFTYLSSLLHCITLECKIHDALLVMLTASMSCIY